MAGGQRWPTKTGHSEDWVGATTTAQKLLEGALAEHQQVIIGIANSQKQRGYFGLPPWILRLDSLDAAAGPNRWNF